MPRGVSVRKGAPEPVLSPLVAAGFMAPPAFYRNQRVSVDAIEGSALKAYARAIGISQRDVDGLSEDRLRQNCKAKILNATED